MFLSMALQVSCTGKGAVAADVAAEKALLAWRRVSKGYWYCVHVPGGEGIVVSEGEGVTGVVVGEVSRHVQGEGSIICEKSTAT